VDTPKNPTTGIVGCCARTASGHAAAAPPASMMKSLRLTDRDHATAGQLKLALEHRE
jgi:hypothetical protein